MSDAVLLSLAWSKLWAWLRSFRLLLRGRWPGFLFLGRGVRFFHLSNMRFGRFVQLEEQVYLSALGREPLELGNNVRIGAYSRLIISTSFNDVG
ncbi:MAG: acyltransferase, partial [Bacteroidota bacterium]